MTAFKRNEVEELNDGEQAEMREPLRVTDKRGQRQPDYMERVGDSLKKESAVSKTLEEMIADCFMEPAPGRVIVQPDPFIYKGKMHIPDTAKRVGTTGTVLKVGFACSAQFRGPVKDDPTKWQYRILQAGDKVAYGTWTGIQFNFDQRPSYRILAEDEIATIITNDATKLLDVEA